MVDNVAMEHAGRPSLPSAGGARLQPHQILFFNRQLASMARLNMPLAKGVKILAKEVEEPVFKHVLERVQRDLEEGIPLSKALSQFPESFSNLYLEVLRTGESSGNLSAILEELTTYSESMMRIKTRIQEALMYPAVISVVIFGFIAFFLLYVTPQTQAMLADAAAGSEKTRLKIMAGLPFTTRGIFTLSELARDWRFSIPALLLLTGMLFWVVQTFRRMGDSYDDVLFRLPLFGKLFHRATLMKLTRTMRELLANGVSMVNTLRLATNIVGNNRVKTKLKELTDAVEEGGSFSRNLASGKVFPDTMVWKLQMAEEKGIIEDALRELAHEFESEVDSLTTVVTKLLSPLLLVFMALIVFLLFVATFMPLTQLSSYAQ